MNKPTKVRAVYDVMRERIESGRLEPGARLASIRRLAEQFQVSAATVKKALLLLKQEALLQGSRGSGVYVSGRREAADVELRGTSKAERISRAILEDITSGRLLLGEHLPVPKVLRYQFQASNKTVAQALRLLVSSGLVWRRGNAYFVGAQTTRKPVAGRRRVIIVGTKGQIEAILRNTRIREFFTEFERELQRCGISRIDLLTEAELAGLDRAALRAVQGILFAGIIDRQLDLATCRKGLDAMRRTGLRTVIYNYPALCDRLPRLKFRPGGRFILSRIGFPAAGERIGLWLVSQGHVRVAFFTFYEQEIAARAPYRHLKRAVEKAAGPRAETFYFTGKFGMGRLLARAKETRLQRAVPAVYRNVYDFAFLDPVRELAGHARNAIARDTLIVRMRPLFEQALRQTRATVWVCDDEHVARCALNYLKEKRRPVPGDISLISLVDGEEAYVNAITAYDFERGRMGYLAAHAILNDVPVKKDRHGYLPSPGKIIERSSVKRAGPT